MNAAGPRLLIYSQDGLGLGHMRRTSLLAAEVLGRLPGSSALTLSDSPLGQFFGTAPGHDFLKLPSIRKAGPERWEAVALRSPVESVLALRSELITAAIRSFDPHVLLIDHMPHGARGELLPALRATRDQRRKVVLGLRDILDAPEVIQRRWAVEHAYEAVQEHVDEVLVYGSRDVFDVAQEYAWPAALRRRLHYCGYVAAPPSRPGTAVAGDYLNRGIGRPRVLVTAGGGADAYPMFSAVLADAAAVHTQTGANLVLVTGPFLPVAQQRALRRQANGLPVTVLTTIEDAPAHLALADLVVCMAGYNSTVEVLSSGKPAVLVPRSGPSAEQRTRSRLFADRGWVRSVDPVTLERGVLADAIVAGLDVPLPKTTGPDLAGRQAAAARLQDLVLSDSWNQRRTYAAT